MKKVYLIPMLLLTLPGCAGLSNWDDLEETEAQATLDGTVTGEEYGTSALQPGDIMSKVAGIASAQNTMNTEVYAAIAQKQDVLAEGEFEDGDKTKLDGIADGATTDQTISQDGTTVTLSGSGGSITLPSSMTPSEVKASYESNADTNAFTNSEKALLQAVNTTTLKISTSTTASADVEQLLGLADKAAIKSWLGITPIETYTLTLTLVGLDGDSINGVSVAGPTDITGLSSSSYALTEIFGGTNDTVVCAGDSVTGSNNNYFLNISSSNQSVTCTFSQTVASGKSLYVDMSSVGGTCSDDTTWANNSITTPWCTVNEAWESAQEGDIVYYRAGDYQITAYIDNSGGADDVTHMPYPPESVSWTSSLSDNHGPINVATNDITVDGIDCNWTGSEGVADDGFFVIGYSSNGAAADRFTLKNGSHYKAKYNGNSGIVHARVATTDISEDCVIDNNVFTGPGEGVGDNNTSLIATFQTTGWQITNNEFRDSENCMYFNKHPNATGTNGGTISNNYFHDCDKIRSQVNGSTWSNNVIDAELSFGYDSGSAIDGNIGSDYNTFDHNTVVDIVVFEDKTDTGDNSYPGSQYNTYTDNIFINGNYEIHRYSSTATNYTGDYNLFSPTTTTIYNNSASYDLAGWQTASGQDANSIEQDPTFVGGSAPTTISGFALATGSAGEDAASDATDMGADVTTVGVQ